MNYSLSNTLTSRVAGGIPSSAILFNGTPILYNGNFLTYN